MISALRLFQSTLPVWGATMRIAEDNVIDQFQSTLPVWGATHSPEQCRWRFQISIHAPRVGSDEGKHYTAYDATQFQSTLPVWGATTNFLAAITPIVISIHAPRVGSDHFEMTDNPGLSISIHAPRVGSDCHWWTFISYFMDFNPRSPCGERPDFQDFVRPPPSFQSTLPVWGATPQMIVIPRLRFTFQSTLPVWGATGWRTSTHIKIIQDFNPRSPCGERQQIYTNKCLQICTFYTIFKCIY